MEAFGEPFSSIGLEVVDVLTETELSRFPVFACFLESFSKEAISLSFVGKCVFTSSCIEIACDVRICAWLNFLSKSDFHFSLLIKLSMY